MELLHKERISLEEQEVNFIFLNDPDLRTIIQGSMEEYMEEYAEDDAVVVFVGYPSYNSVIPTESVNFPVSLIKDLYP